MNPDPTPLVSVIMNAYYSEEFLGEAIASVMAQTYSNWEIILWENESSDGTREIAASFNDPRIRYFFSPNKVSLYESRMNAFKKARGDFVAFLDCDDLWMPEKLDSQVAVFADPNCVVSCTDYIVMRKESGDKSGRTSMNRYNTYRVASASPYAVASDYRVGMSSVMVRHATAQAVWPLIPPNYSIIEDFDMVVRLVTAGALVPLTEPQMIYRWHGNNFSLRLDIESSEWESWIGNMGMLGMTHESEVILRNQIGGRLLRMKCRQLRLRGDRRGAWNIARKMPLSRSKLKWVLSLALPTRLVSHLVSTQ